MRNLPIFKEKVNTKSRSQMIDITPIVQKRIAQERIGSGFAIVYVPHTTAAITINENADPDVQNDLLAKLAEMIPHREAYYRHTEGNSDSHVKTSLVGNSVMVMIEGGQLVLGQWQGIQLCEFDGPRPREVLVKIVSLDRPDVD